MTTARSWICKPAPIHTSEYYTSNDTLFDSPAKDLRTLTPTQTRRRLQRHPVWQPGLRSANPDPYTADDTSSDTLCDSPVLHLRTLAPTHTRRHLQRHPVRQPGLARICDHYTHHRRHLPCVTARSWICERAPTHMRRLYRLGAANPDPSTAHTHSHPPAHNTSSHTLCDSPPGNESTKSGNPHPPNSK